MEIGTCKTWVEWIDCSTRSKLETEFCSLSFFCFPPPLKKKTQTGEGTRKPSGSQRLQVSHSGLPSKWGFRSTSLKPITERCLPISPRTWLFLASHSIAFILFVLHNENKRKWWIVHNHQGYYRGNGCKMNWIQHKEGYGRLFKTLELLRKAYNL